VFERLPVRRASAGASACAPPGRRRGLFVRRCDRLSRPPGQQHPHKDRTWDLDQRAITGRPPRRRPPAAPPPRLRTRRRLLPVASRRANTCRRPNRAAGSCPPQAEDAELEATRSICCRLVVVDGLVGEPLPFSSVAPSCRWPAPSCIRRDDVHFSCHPVARSASSNRGEGGCAKSGGRNTALSTRRIASSKMAVAVWHRGTQADLEAEPRTRTSTTATPDADERHQEDERWVPAPVLVRIRSGNATAHTIIRTRTRTV